MKRTHKDECKTKHLHLMLRPTVVGYARKVAHMHNDSLNNVVDTLLEQYIRRNFKSIAEYDLYVKD